MAAEKSTIETAKQRSLRVPLGHHRQRTTLVNWKSFVAVVAMVAAAAYVVWLLMPTSASRRHLSPGPVTVSHAMWDNDCAQCHLDFRPQRSDAVDFVSLVGKAPQAQDQACVRCHPGPPHHHNVKADNVQSCATCHRDHLGREANITRSSDVHCTSCHADVAAHRSGPGVSPPIENVTAFGPAATSGPSSHPQFRSLQSDPGTIKFNHWLHMQPGISLPGGRKQLRWSDLPESDREKYAPFKNNEGLVQLACATCHRLTPDEGPTVADTMAPIAYERHCRACHPLDAKLGDGEANPLTVPHGLNVARVTALVEGLLAEVERKPLTKAGPTADESGDAPLIPGRTLGKNLAQKIAADALARRGTVLGAIHAKCQQCHEVQPVNAGLAGAPLPEVRPSNVPSAWLKHGRFAHAAHEHLQCRDCHAQAYAFEQKNQPQMILPGNEQLPAGYTAATDCDQVMIANLENCVTCHTPAAKGGGGARHDCAECHRYHHASETAAKPKVASVMSNPKNAKFAHSLFDLRPSTFDLRPSTFDIRPLSPALKLVSHRADLRSSGPALVGVASCAASGCHGDSRPGASASANAFHTWLQNDPHARAYDVLWTFRGREMTRLLSLGNSGNSDFSDEQHRQVLAERCLGCHATPANHDRPAADSDYALGVHCESCHGAAGGWLFEHQRIGATAKPGSGQINTKNLAERAAACMGCHVGPSVATGTPQPVDHDLIAAGHPRLNFEFHSYFQSLPAHWDRARDEKQLGEAFHFRAWQTGLAKQSAQFAALTQHFAEKSAAGGVDYATVNCYACHHSLAGDGARQQHSAGRDLLVPAPPLTLPAAIASPTAADSAPSAAQRVGWAKEFVTRAGSSQAMSWGHSLQAYLAVCATMADLTPATRNTPDLIDKLNTAMREFGRYLGQECYGLSRPVTIYDSPTRYSAAVAKRHHEALASLLQEFEAFLLIRDANPGGGYGGAIPAQEKSATVP